MTGAPAGHVFRIGRTKVEHGWRLFATCRCKHAVSADTYPDLNALINDHYADVRHQRDTEREEAAHQ